MIKRTIEISNAAAHLTVKHDQLTLKREGDIVGSIPCEDLGVVVVDHPATTYTHSALTRILDFDATVILCGSDHLPKGMLIPFADHSQVVSRIDLQISVAKPVRKRLWQQLVREKILRQAENLRPDSVPHRKLLQFAAEVKSGDTTNREAQAAKLYWSSWLTVIPEENEQQAESVFRRQRDGDAPNSLLNYGYAIIRAAIARALVAGGLVPAIGLHHSNRSNPFCLADDLIEPFRPMVDSVVRDLYWAEHTELDQPAKQQLLELLAIPVASGNQTGPLMVAFHRMVASLVRCFEGTQKELEIPKP